MASESTTRMLMRLGARIMSKMGRCGNSIAGRGMVKAVLVKVRCPATCRIGPSEKTRKVAARVAKRRTNGARRFPKIEHNASVSVT